MLTRFGQEDSTGNHFLAKGGPQLQQHAIPGFRAEEIPAGATHAGFIAPIVAGVGFIDALSDASILANADPSDADGDGISGVPNWIKLPAYATAKPNSVTVNAKYIGRFGRKASTYDLQQQTVNAFVQDMGITSSYAKQNPVNYLDYLTAIPSNTPEVDDKNFNALVFYLQALQTPLQRTPTDAQVVAGKKVFYAIHVEKQTLNTADLVSAWAQKQGIDKAKFTELYNSFPVNMKTRKATQLQEAFMVDGVPALGVDGRYYTSGSLAGTMVRALTVTDHVLTLARKTKAAPAKAK